MAYRELWVIEVKEVLRIWSLGRSFRAVGRQSGADRKTVRRYVETARALGFARGGDSRALDDALVAAVVSAIRPGGRREAQAMRLHCRTHRALIEGWLREGCKGPKVVKLLGRHTGVVVPLRTLQRFITEELEETERRGETVRIVDPPPGQVLEVDFLELGVFEERGSGRRRKMHALLCTAGHSRHQFLWPCLEQTQAEVIAGLEAAWRFFGGVFPQVVFDNLKAVVEVPDPIAPKLNPSFVEYAQARDFEIDPARKRKAKDKARVERQVRYARDDYFRGEHFGSLDEARQEAERWCREDAGERTHGTTRLHPLEVFEQRERPLLKPAPTEPYDTPRWSTVHVGRDHAVVLEHALYSVPCGVPEGALRARVDRATVKLYRGAVLVKVHPRKGAGEASIDGADAPPGQAELVTRDSGALQRRAASLGASVGEYARRLLDGPMAWSRMRHVYRLLSLGRRHGGELLDEACARALELDVVDVLRVERMLQRGLLRRGLLSPPPAPARRDNVVPLRFARDPKEWRPIRPDLKPPEEPDAPA